jgi:putative RecB family exonuclease
MGIEKYLGLKIEPKEKGNFKNKYSITADIMSYKRCNRQYGHFSVKNFQPSSIVQLWYGMLIHQVLDKLHLQYKGLIDKEKKNMIPTNEDVEKYFNAVNVGLLANGIKSKNRDEQKKALNVLSLFNQFEGPKLYKYVEDSECNLQTDQGSYILHGVVDLLKEGTSDHSSIHDNFEIWDYKGSKIPENNLSGKKKLKQYKYQMLVYAELYKLKSGKYPSKGVIYFINELKEENLVKTSQKAKYVIDFRKIQNMKLIEKALDDFNKTVYEIEDKKINDNWEISEPSDKETCAICDLRWDCKKVNYSLRYP